jgi:hypothetical protein
MGRERLQFKDRTIILSQLKVPQFELVIPKDTGVLEEEMAIEGLCEELNHHDYLADGSGD